MNADIKTYTTSFLVAFLLLPIILPSYFTPRISIALGSTNNVPAGEIAADTALASMIANYSSQAGYTTQNWYGSQTNASNIYLAAGGDGYNYSLAFYIGHGGWDYTWDGIFYSKHWCITDNNGGLVWDKDIFGYTACGYTKFVLLWSCEQGDTIGGLYWFGAAFGMPLAWLHTTSLSIDGYVNPDSGMLAFLGFNGEAPFLTNTLGGVTDAGLSFLYNFYYAAMCMGYYFTINAALDYAAEITFGSINFGNCILYTGLGYGNMVVYGDGNWHISLYFSKPACAMKTRTDGYFYVPKAASRLLKVEMLFDNQNITGDQTGGTPPYSSIQNYPDGRVDIKDVGFISQKFGLIEGQSDWNYMADVVPDRKINIGDVGFVGKNFGKTGTYITDLSGVTVTFNTGEEISPDATGFITIPQGATSFTVKRNSTPIGAMIIFW
jgi:hypothetical protein